MALNHPVWSARNLHGQIHLILLGQSIPKTQVFDMELHAFLDLLGTEIVDTEEGSTPTAIFRSALIECGFTEHCAEIVVYSLETFLLFCQSFPSQNLGFVDPKASVVDFTIDGRDLAIHQSPGLLTSGREGGTTGAGRMPSTSRFMLSKVWLTDVAL